MKNLSKITGWLLTMLVLAIGIFSGVATVLPADAMVMAPMFDSVGFMVQQPELYFSMTMLVGLPKGVGHLRKGGPAGIKDTAWAFRKRDVLFMPPRDANGVLIAGSVVMKPGTFMGEFYGTQSLIEIKEMTEGNADQEGSKPSVVLVHPGSYLEVQEWYKANMHEDMYLIIERCSGEMELYGDCCNGLRIQREKTLNGTESSNKFTFTAPLAGDVAAIYRGTITKEGFAATLPANNDSPVLNITGGRILAPAHNTGLQLINDIDGLNDIDGAVFTLVGGAGAGEPYMVSFEDKPQWITKSFSGYQLTPGVEVTFKVMHLKSGETTDTKVYIEIGHYIP